MTIHGHRLAVAVHCALCKRPLSPKITLPRVFQPENMKTKDHFWPSALMQKGQGNSKNIWPLCLSCNARKANRMPTARETVAFCRWLNPRGCP